MSKCPCLNILLLCVHGGLYYIFIITLCQNARLNMLLLYVHVGLYYLFIISLLCQNVPVSTYYCYMFMVGFITYLLLLCYVKMSLSQHITFICSWWALLLIYYYYFVMSRCQCLNILLIYVNGGFYYLFIIIIITLLCKNAHVSTYYCYMFMVGFITYFLLCQNVPVSTYYCYMFMVGFITYLLLLLLVLYYVTMPLSQWITVIC